MSFVSKWKLFVKFLESEVDNAPEVEKTLVKTTRYLRLAMVGMALGLAAAVVYEFVKQRAQTDHSCLLGSISAYYYTPVHAIFVGALITIGVCLVALRGNTDLEDVLLNLAGIFAPFVALVPTPTVPNSCNSALSSTVYRSLAEREGSSFPKDNLKLIVANRDLGIGNNVFAAFVVAGAGLFLLAVLGRRAQTNTEPRADKPTAISIVGYAIFVVLFVVAISLFWFRRPGFTEHAHPAAAISMFVFIDLNVLLNGYNLYRSRQNHPELGVVTWHNRYTSIGLVMIVSAVVIVLSHGKAHWVLVLEASQIALFTLFWICQTVELWTPGLRSLASQPPADLVPAAPVPD
jgi:hypothetical protein